MQGLRVELLAEEDAVTDLFRELQWGQDRGELGCGAVNEDYVELKHSLLRRGDSTKSRVMSPLENVGESGGERWHANCIDCMYNACMATSITIRNVPDDTRDELAARAARSGRSLQEYLRSEMIELARKTDIEALLSRAEARKRASGSSLSPDKIIEHRDADRR